MSAAAPGAGPAVLAGEVLGRVRAELPMVGGLGEREQLLVSAWLTDLVRRLARTAGIGAWEQLSPHSLRRSALTFALDAGASLRAVQDYAGHKDPRTTRHYVSPKSGFGLRSTGSARTSSTTRAGGS